MTDSVEKTLQVEGLTAAPFSSKYVPLHVLCVYRTCETFDCGNLLVLKYVEEKSDLKEKVVKCIPSLMLLLMHCVNDGH